MLSKLLFYLFLNSVYSQNTNSNNEMTILRNYTLHKSNETGESVYEINQMESQSTVIPPFSRELSIREKNIIDYVTNFRNYKNIERMARNLNVTVKLNNSDIYYDSKNHFKYNLTTLSSKPAKDLSTSNTQQNVTIVGKTNENNLIENANILKEAVITGDYINKGADNILDNLKFVQPIVRDDIIWKVIEDLTPYYSQINNVLSFFKKLPSGSRNGIAKAYYLKMVSSLNLKAEKLIEIGKNIADLSLSARMIYFFKKVYVQQDATLISVDRQNNNTISLREFPSTVWTLVHKRRDIFEITTENGEIDLIYASINHSQYSLALTSENVSSSEWKISPFEGVVRIFNVNIAKFLCTAPKSSENENQFLFLSYENENSTSEHCKWIFKPYFSF